MPEQNDPTLAPDYLARIEAYWRAANYLSVGQIYLLDNPLLREPLSIEHIKPRLLGHWGTTPGLNFIYVHLNRIINKYDLDMIYIAGPGHGGPALVAIYNADGSHGRGRLMLAVNPHTDDTSVPIGEFGGWSWELLADHECFYHDGQHPPGQVAGPELFIPALGCSLWWSAR